MSKKISLLQEIITKVVQREIEKAKVELRKEMYLAINETTKFNKPIVSNTKVSNRITPTSSDSNLDRTSIMEFLGMSTNELKSENTPQSLKIIDVPPNTEFKPEVQSVIDIINSTDLAKKAKLMEQAAMKNR